MAKEQEGPETSVRKWLANAGYPLELRAARAFSRGHGLHVTSSDYYLDPETGRAREIDLVVSRHIALGGHVSLIVAAVVECKTPPPNQQWVGFLTGSRLPALLAAKDRPASDYGRGWLELLQVPLHDRTLSAPMLFGDHPQVHGLTTTWQSGKDEDRDMAYKAVQGAAHAAHARVATWDEGRGASPVVGLVFPVVVFGGDLFVASLGEDSDDLDVVATDRLQVVWREPLGRSDYTVVDVVTEAGLPALVEELATTATAMTEQGAAAAQRAYDDRGPAAQVF